MRSTFVSADTPDAERAVKLFGLVEISDWLDWMKSELPPGGVDLPSEETSVLFAARSVHLAERVRYLSRRHLPTRLRTELIQASILHQCWAWRSKLQGDTSVHVPHMPKLQTNRAVKFVGRLNGDSVIKAADGHNYVVRFPSSNHDTALATEAIGLVLARLMGLPVPDVSVTLASRELVRRAGIGSVGSPRYAGEGNGFSCLGLRLVENLDFNYDVRKKVMDRKGGAYRIGTLVFDILTLNMAREQPALRVINGRSEPIFLYRSGCMLNSNWPRFIKANYRTWIGPPLPTAGEVTSKKQLEPWLRRARNVDLNHVWHLVFSLPPAWYGENRASVAGILRKLEARIWNLRNSVDYLIREDAFPNMRDP